MNLSAFRLSCALATALVSTLAAGQAPPIKPGLWEVQADREIDGKKMAPPADRLKNMPPAARAQMEAMMKERGMAMGEGGATRMCVTKETLASGKLQGELAGCKTDWTRAGSVWKYHSSCPELKAESDGDIVFSGGESYTMTVSTTMSSVTPPRLSKTTRHGKWMGASCGDLKPLSTTP